jgi:hypothetical protein
MTEHELELSIQRCLHGEITDAEQQALLAELEQSDGWRRRFRRRGPTRQLRSGGFKERDPFGGRRSPGCLSPWGWVTAPVNCQAAVHRKDNRSRKVNRGLPVLRQRRRPARTSAAFPRRALHPVRGHP